MGLSGKVKNKNESWGLGLLLVFFLDDENNNEDNHHKYIDKKKNLTSLKSISSDNGIGSNTPTSFNSKHKLLINKAQSTISICALIFFFTLLLFTLSTFEPSINSSSSSNIDLSFSRRWLIEKNYNLLDETHIKKSSYFSSSVNNFALQGMGTLFRRGTRAMNDLIVAHLTEDITHDELQLFLRTLHRSSITAKSDVVFIYSSSLSSNFTTIIQQENDSFLKLVHHYRTNNHNDSSINVMKNLKMINGFDVTQFSKSNTNKAESLWGRRIRSSNYSNSNSSEEEENSELINELSWGSIVGFETAELDPEDSLSGFFNDPPPIRLRRWACYPMLLGRLRRNFKHIMLVDVKNVVVLGDSFSRVMNRNAESIHLWTIDKTQSHHNTKDHQSKQPLTSDLIMGGMKGVRRLSNSMLNEIVRAAIKHKSETNSVTDSVILSQLIHNESLLKNIDVSVITESSIPEMSSLINTATRNSGLNHQIVHRGNRNLDLNFILFREICSSLLDSSIYTDC